MAAPHLAAPRWGWIVSGVVDAAGDELERARRAAPLAAARPAAARTIAFSAGAGPFPLLGGSGGILNAGGSGTGRDLRARQRCLRRRDLAWGGTPPLLTGGSQFRLGCQRGRR